jgi:ABC-type antimicrobial peptide transport system permease subunit
MESPLTNGHFRIARHPLAIILGSVQEWVLMLATRKIMASVIEIHPGHDIVLVLNLSAGFAVIGILSAILPALRAASVDPMQVLRAE